MHRARARARAPCVLLLELLLAFLPVHVTVCDLGFALFALAIACSFGDAARGAVPAPPPRAPCGADGVRTAMLPGVQCLPLRSMLQ